jgi:phospholipid/cholesterol/gamma-HCH transport system substrate-binding protein
MFDRKKELKWAKLKVGIVITVTLAIIFIATIFSGGIQKLFTQREFIKIAISDVKGLKAGAPVMIAGIEVGQVREIKLHKELGTIVSVAIDKEVLTFLKEDAKASVQTMGLLGDKYLEITIGHSEKPFNKSQIIEGYPQPEMRDIISVATSTLIRIDKLINDFNKMIHEIRTSKGTVYKFLNDPTLYNNLHDTISELKITIEEIRSGNIGKLSQDKELYQKISSTIKNFEEFSIKLNTSPGSLGKFINEPELYDNLVKSSYKLDKILQEIEKSEGPLHLLLRDKQTSEDLKQSIKELRNLIKELKELTEEIRKNPKKFFKFSIF